ncbi:hypothetical protein ABZT08_05315 [Streptomyces sp. NPDC005526]|uniref:hypothetical protein n=1 Tax=Streptomyces sp. NPDC005526 TaxID=3156885 RepID=UPI0033B529C8
MTTNTTNAHTTGPQRKTTDADAGEAHAPDTGAADAGTADSGTPDAEAPEAEPIGAGTAKARATDGPAGTAKAHAADAPAEAAAKAEEGEEAVKAEEAAAPATSEDGTRAPGSTAATPTSDPAAPTEDGRPCASPTVSGGGGLGGLPWNPRGRGRHRRPRPRRVLLAAGGLALAAGVLSLVRLAPESGVGGLGTAEAEPHHPGAGYGADRTVETAATPGTAPAARPSAAFPLVSAAPTTAASGTGPRPSMSRSPADGARARTASGAPASVPTTIPEIPNAPDGPPAPTATSAPQPNPTPTPTPEPTRSHGSHTPAPKQPELCVPIIGLCVKGGGAR